VASQTRPSASEEERRDKIRTLVVATVASGTAAVVTSQFWIAGTWVAAAISPVLVTLIRELLNRPTEAIASRLTSEGDALPPKPTRSEELLDEQPARAPAEAPVNVYRSGGGRARPRPRARRKVAVGAVVTVAALAFAITAVAMTGTELITGGSIGKGSGKTTLFEGGNKQPDENRDTTTTPSQQDQQQDTEQDQQTPEQTTPETEPQTAPEEQDTEQTVPEQTAPAPRSAPPTTTSP
jgi:hypothetical protein